MVNVTIILWKESHRYKLSVYMYSLKSSIQHEHAFALYIIYNYEFRDVEK